MRRQRAVARRRARAAAGRAGRNASPRRRRPPSQSSTKARGKPAPNRPAMSKARSIAPNSIWASACSIAIRLRSEPALPRFGMRDGGSSSGRCGPRRPVRHRDVEAMGERAAPPGPRRRARRLHLGARLGGQQHRAAGLGDRSIALPSAMARRCTGGGRMSFTAKILLLGSGELGREFAISAKRLGAYRDRLRFSYAGAPAMQVADACEVFPMLDGAALRAAVEKHRPDFIVPEIEAIRTEELLALEAEGWHVVPSARAARDDDEPRRDPRRSRPRTLGLRTSRYRFAESLDEVLRRRARTPACPASSSRSCPPRARARRTVRDEDELEAAWDYAVANMRGDRPRVIVEEFVDFDYEITLLTVRTGDGHPVLPADRPPPGTRRLSAKAGSRWRCRERRLAQAQEMARADRRRSRRPRHFRRRILHRRRRGDLLGAQRRGRTTPAW